MVLRSQPSRKKANFPLSHQEISKRALNIHTAFDCGKRLGLVLQSHPQGFPIDFPQGVEKPKFGDCKSQRI